jgi:hypothetical protein
MCRWYVILGAFGFQIWKTRSCLSAPTNSSNKVISGNVVTFTSVSNLSNQSITPCRLCDSSNSVFEVYKMVNYNK